MSDLSANVVSPLPSPRRPQSYRSAPVAPGAENLHYRLGTSAGGAETDGHEMA